MALFDDVVSKFDNFKGYEGNPPTTEKEYNALDCWKNLSKKPAWETILSNIALEKIKALREKEYPPHADYLDGIVKGDDAQVQKYIDDCLAVKAKYPKGDE
jgi:hypothetical protein